MKTVKKSTQKRIIRKPLLFFIIIMVALVALSSLWVFSDYGFVGKAVKMELIKLSTPKCSDGIDNDHDSFVDWGFTNTNDPSCSSPFDTSEADMHAELKDGKVYADISWSDFPDFHLHSSLIAVYNGVILNGNHQGQVYVKTYGNPLNKGFSHIATFGGLSKEQLNFITVNKRAIGFSPWGGNAGWCDLKGQPLFKFDTKEFLDKYTVRYNLPWGNDLNAFKKCMDTELQHFASLFSDTMNDNLPKGDLLVSDVETMPFDDSTIRLLYKNRNSHPISDYIPDEIKKLSEEDFVNQYKHDMAYLYNEVIGYPKAQGFSGKIGSYGDVPITYKYWWSYHESIPPNSFKWGDWTSNEIFSKICNKGEWSESCGNYVTFNFGEYMQKPGNNFFSLGKLTKETMDLLTPSAYYAYGYRANDEYKGNYEFNDTDWMNAAVQFYTGLLKADMNTAFSQGKPVIIFRLLRYGANGGTPMGTPGIEPWVAHATAIFPYFSKNVGQWLWDYTGFDVLNSPNKFVNSVNQVSENRIAYDNFIYGLYRLSQYNHFFNGNYQTYHPVDALELARRSYYPAFQGSAKIWRGIVKEDGMQMLVAAYNPFATLDSITKYQITCPSNVTFCIEGAPLGEIQTTGFNVWLGVCNLDGSGGCTGDQGEKVVKQPVKTGIRESVISKKKARIST